MQRHRYLAALLALVTAGAFSRVLEADFVSWDDPQMLVYNPNYRGLGWPQIAWAFTTFWYHHYHPLTWLSYGLDYVVWGMNPVGYHLTNLLGHAASGALVFLLARRLLTAARAEVGPAVNVGAVVAAVAFALHPLRVEPVAWATGRRDVLATFFTLLTVLAYLRAVTPEAGAERPPARRRWLIAATAFYLAALLSKTIAMTVPVILVVLDWYPLRRSLRDRRVWLEKLPFAALGLAAAAVAVVAVSRVGFTGLAVYGLGDRLALAAFSLCFYAWKTLLPTGLSPLYEAPAHLDPLDLRFVVSVATVIAVSVCALLLRRRTPWVLAAWAAYAIPILPVSGLTHAGYQVVYDRYSYLPGVALAVLLGAGVVALLDAWRRGRIRASVAATVVSLGVVVLGAWVAIAERQIPVWHDPISIWRRAVAVDPACVICQTNLGAVLMMMGQLEDAEQHFRRALVVRPGAADAAHNLGEILRSFGGRAAEAGRFDDAVRLLAEAAQLRPGDPGIASELARAREAAATARGR